MKYIIQKNNGYLETTIPKLYKVMERGFKPVNSKNSSYIERYRVLLEDEYDMINYLKIYTKLYNLNAKEYFDKIPKIKATISKQYLKLPKTIQEVKNHVQLYYLKEQDIINKKFINIYNETYDILGLHNKGLIHKLYNETVYTPFYRIKGII